MRIMGIDPGYGIIGYGIIEKNGNRITPLTYGVIETPKEESTAVRLAILNERLTEIIQKYSPEEIAVEDLFFNTNITTGIKVAQARGVILLCSVLQCGKLYEYTPLQIKQALTGEGRADKRQVQYMVRAILKLTETPKPDDAADALAVAICHSNTGRFGRDLK